MNNIENIEEKSYRVAEPLLEGIKDMLKSWGLDAGRIDRWESFIYLGLIVLLSLFVTWLLHFVLHFIFKRVTQRSHNRVLQVMAERGLFSGIAYVFSPLIVLAFLPWVYGNTPHLIMWIGHACEIIFVAVFWYYINRSIDAFWHIFSQRDAWRDRPLKGVMQLLKGIALGVAFILIMAILIGVSPMKFITGLGAFAAVLMLVFKNVILGFVAGVQLADNDLVRQGDRIVLPGDMVDGIVEDITLFSVKVRNFDNTIISLPPYSLISSQMQNWRTMYAEGGRRILQTFLIAADTVRPCTESALDGYASLPFMKEYIAGKRAQYAAGKVVNTADPSGLANGTIETNLGLFRAYVAMYLAHNPSISSQYRVLAYLSETNEYGVVFEIFCFSTQVFWNEYTSVRSEVMEHIIVAAGWFDLRIYQRASAHDYLSQADIIAGRVKI